MNEDKQEAYSIQTGYIKPGSTSTDPSGTPIYDGSKYTEWHDSSSQNKWTVKRGENGEITVDYDLVLAGVLEDIAPHINGSITFRPNGKGNFDVTGERDGFPWAEAYLHDGKGGVKIIFRDPAKRGNPEDLNAVEDEYGFWKPIHTARAKTLADPRPQVSAFCKPRGPC